MVLLIKDVVNTRHVTQYITFRKDYKYLMVLLCFNFFSFVKCSEAVGNCWVTSRGAFNKKL